MGEICEIVKKPVQAEEPWQASSSLSERWLHVWKEKVFTDVLFLVGYEEVEVACHKVLLVLHSPVFETMFGQRWTLSEGPNASFKIPLPEEDVETFNLFLEFVYSGSFSSKDIQKIISVLALGKKYLCSDLIRKCVEMLIDSLTVENVMEIYQVAEMVEEGELAKATEEYILHNANNLFTSGEITKINKTDLCKLLRNDELNVAEVDLFNAVYSWGRNECVKLELSPEEGMEKVLRDLIPLIRFTNMSPEEFSTVVVPKNVLPLEDTVKIFTFMTTPQEKREELKPNLDLKFNTTRRSLSYFVYNLRRLKGHGFDFGTKWQNFCFQADRDVRIISLGFFRAVEPGVTLEVGMKILNEDMTQTLGEVLESHTKCTASQDIFHVKFKTPVRICKDTLITISYIVKGKETFYKTVGESTITANCGAEGRVTFKFKEAQQDNDMDQVPEICFRLQ